MAKFEDAIGYVMSNEGTFSDHPHDPGGPTFWGISLRFLEATGTDVDGDGDVDEDDVRALARVDAIALYGLKFWKPLELDRLKSQAVATRVLDMAVNMGCRRSVKIAQKAANEMSRGIGFEEKGEPAVKLKIDGKLGPKTRARFNGLGRLDDVLFMVELRKAHGDFYRALAKKRPELEVFLDGWLNRAAK